MDVRRLAAVDMHGAHGTRLRRRVFDAEIVLGAVVGTTIGIAVAVTASSLAWQVFGAWIAGACLNYVPLALHAIALSRPGQLDAELEGVDVPQELRHYTKAQFWIAVPLLFVLLAMLQLRAEPRRA
jgi:hypothetical protein